MELDVKIETVHATPRVLSASWDFNEMLDLEVERDNCLRKLKPIVRHKARTVKQRNKQRWTILFKATHNCSVRNHRYYKQEERAWMSKAADEIRKEIDAEIIASLRLYAEMHQSNE